MKKTVARGNWKKFARPFALWLAAGFVTPLCHGAKAADFTVGISTRSGGYFEASMKSLWAMTTPIFKKRLKVNLKMNFLPEDDAFVKSFSSQKPDFAYTNNVNILAFSLKGAYQPLVGVKVLGSSTAERCLYVSSKNGAAGLGHLKNRSAVTYTGEVDYYLLRALLRERPEAFFSSLRVSPSGQDSLYALALGQTDAAFVNRADEGIFKIANPGPLKKVRRLTCTRESVPFNPVFAHPRVPAATRQKLVQVLVGMAGDEAFKSFHPLLKKTGFGFVPYNHQQFRYFLRFMQKNQKRDWRKDYLAWAKSAQGKR